MDPEIVEHYIQGAYEHARLETGVGRLEQERTRELLARSIPAPPADVLDVGGAAGVYAAWLADAGYRVHLLDPVPLHVDQAREAARGRYTVELGDARSLPQPPASVDVVLLLGPMYHLTERDDRMKALTEATRVVRPGGVVAVAAISRFAAVLDGLARGFLADPAFRAIAEADLRDGQHRNPARRPGWFTTAFFHHPDELAAEIRDAGLSCRGVFSVEGIASMLPRDEFDLRWSDPAQRGAILFAARALEREPSLAGLGPHLLAIADRPD